MQRLPLIELLIITAFMLAGCLTMPADPAKMTPEQLTAFAKDKNANIACTTVNSPYGRGISAYVVLDKSVVPNGSITVDDQCKVNVINSPLPPKP
jgi:starvation-inducible outer membrane lipoprotein